MIEAAMKRLGRELISFHCVGVSYVVVCKINNEVTPYATWRADDQGNTFWGHYFETQSVAMDDYRLRCKALERSFSNREEADANLSH